MKTNKKKKNVSDRDVRCFALHSLAGGVCALDCVPAPTRRCLPREDEMVEGENRGTFYRADTSKEGQCSVGTASDLGLRGGPRLLNWDAVTPVFLALELRRLLSPRALFYSRVAAAESGCENGISPLFVYPECAPSRDTRRGGKENLGEPFIGHELRKIGANFSVLFEFELSKFDCAVRAPAAPPATVSRPSASIALNK